MQAMPAAAIESPFEEQTREFFRSVMDRENITQTRVADEIGVSQGQIAQMLNGASGLKLQRTADFARALGYEIVFVKAKKRKE